MCCFTWASAWSQQLLFVVLAAGLWCFTAGCHVKSPLFPQPPLKQQWAPRWEKASDRRLHNPTHSANEHVVQIYRSSLSAAVQTVQVSVEPRLSIALKDRSVVIAQSLCPSPLPRFQQRCLCTSRTMGESISTIQRSPQISMSYKFAAPRNRLPPMALQTVQVSVEPPVCQRYWKIAQSCRNTKD